MHTKTNRLAIFGLFIACFLLSSQISTSNVSAYTASITTNDSIELDITPNGNGTSIHSESINVASDCRAGYNLTIATPEGSNLYKYENNAQSSTTASFTAVDGTSALNSDNNTNKWGYTVTSNPTSSTVFSPLSSTASILKTPSQTASPEADINDTSSINYGAKVDNTVEAGTYQMANNGAIVYYLTMDTTCTQYTVSFNPNGGTGTMDNQGIEAGESTNLSTNTFTAPAFGSSYEDANGDTITGTTTTYWRFNGWNTAIDGTGTAYDNEEEVEDLVGAGSTITLYAQWEALSAMVVNFNTNGMEFEDGTTNSTLGYYHGCRDRYVSQPSYSHTANINDDGTQIGSTKYANNLATKDVIAIPNADSLHVTIKYGTENNWDMLYVFQGEYTGSVTRNMNAGQLATYMGGNNTTTTVELDIPGDTATFAFYSDSSGQYWGYHATVVGYYDEEPESYASTVEVCDRHQVYGEYREPAPDDDHLFYGWSENSSATTPDYTSADEILNNLSGENGDTKTLYAIWNPIYHITYVNNCQAYISGNEACTADVSSGTGSQNINLNSSGDGSTTLPAYNYNSWTITGWKIKGWSTVADNSSGANTEYQVSSNYSVTGQGAGASITLYAHWVPVYSIQYDGNGADNPNDMGTTDSGTDVKSVKQINVGEGDPVTLLASNFKKAGNGFAGWSTDPDAWTHFTDNDNTNDPVIYGPMETISAPAYPNNGTNINTMYAVWIPAKKDSSNNTVYFQDWDNPNTTLPHDGCSTLTATIFDDTETNEKDKIKVTKDSVVALTDKRDNEVYTVARLADGKCWMTENLRLDAEYTMGQNQNDPTVTNQYLSQGYGGTTGTYGNFVGLAESEAITNTIASNSIYKSATNPPVDTYNPVNHILEDIGVSDNPIYRLPRYNNLNNSDALSSPTYTEDYIDISSPSISGTYHTSAVSSYGNYYNWAAAMANTNHYTSPSVSESAGTSICPSGWHLPSSGSAVKESGTLSQRYGGNGDNQGEADAGGIMSNRFRIFPNNFLYSGHFYGSSASFRGSYGNYLSRSAYSYSASYVMTLSPTYLYPSPVSGKLGGSSVRCLVSATDVEIVLDSNNGTDAVSRVYGAPNVSITLPSSSSPSASNAQPGYAFKNWNTAPDGSGTSYTNRYTIPAGSTGITLYAQWAPQYAITYVNNCMTYASTNASCTQTASDGTSVQKLNLDASGNGSGTLKASNAWTTMSGWKIAGWNTSADGTGTEYRASSTYAVTGQSAGDEITLYAHWVPTYSIQYDGNGASNPNGMGTMDDATGVKSVKQTNVGEGDPVVLLASNFKKAGYGFAGWSTSPTATIGGTDKIYGPMETIDAPAYPTNGTNIITMYAVWVAAEKDTNDNPVYLQDFTASDCNALTSADFNASTGVITPGSVIALTDKRDDEVYTIAKLADDNCWMIENLRLETAGTLGNNKNDSSVTNQSLSQGYGGTTGTYGNFVGLADSESANFGSTASNSIYKSSAALPTDTYDPANNILEDIGTTNYPAYRFPRYNSDNTQSLVDSTTYTENYANASSPSTSGTYKTSTVSSYGNYYTWAAAMANTNYYTSSSTSEAAGTSLCPSNWHLPSSDGAAKEFGTLSQKYGGKSYQQTGVVMSNRFRSFPNNFLYSGYFGGSSAGYRGTNGYYWSRSTNGDNNSYNLTLYSNGLDPSNGYWVGKSGGFSIRCLIGS